MKKNIYNKKLLMLSSFVLLFAAGCNTVSQTTNNRLPENLIRNMPEINHNSPHSQNTPTQSHRTYSLNILSDFENIQPGKSVDVRFNIKDEQGNVLKDFQVTHKKLLHFVVVRKDLQQFQHIHPVLNQQTGEFSVSVTFPTDGPYRTFADFAPKNAQMGPGGMPLMVTLNKDLAVGNMGKYQVAVPQVDNSILKTVDGYRVNYNFPKEIKAQTEVEFSLIIEKDNVDVKLENYLGAKGHSVILRKDNLDYIHTHAQDMNHGGDAKNSMNHEMSGDSVTFDTSFPEPGIYKVFTQFQINGKVLTSDYTLQVK